MRACMIAVASSLAVIAAVVKTADADETPPVAFETHVAAIFQTHCVSCHGGDEPEAGLDLSTSDGIRAGSESGPVLRREATEQSVLLKRVQDGSMPPEGTPGLNDLEKRQIQDWIQAGAVFRNADAERKPVTSDRIAALMLLRCAVCHGAERQEGGLDLRTAAGLLKGGQSGPAVVPGKPDESLMLQRIVSQEMPPRRKLVEVSIKPITDHEVELLRRWIAEGCPQSELVGDRTASKSDRSDPLVSPEDLEFWAFQPPQRPAVPAVQNRMRVRTPIDAFVLRKLEQRGLEFSPDAGPLVLLRRACLDLTGLPPTPEQTEAFLADDAALRYERLIDRLLASPHYGVRWGRHWLDVAGYADSEGAQNEDRVRPHLWRYRDYVIRAFNADTPYSQFLHEQIAGDELADYESASEIDETLYENLVATGFLRTAPDRTFANITAFVPDRLEVVADEIQILSTAVLGLTLQCARCHSHKFDPIPQRDYYRLAAIFKDAYDEHDWLKSGPPRTLPHVTTRERAAWEAHEERLQAQIAELEERKAATSDATERQALDEQIATLQQQRRPEPRIRALWSRGRPSPTWILLRGNYRTPGPRVEPGVPSVLNRGRLDFDYAPPWPGAQKTGRRLAFARWLTQPDHPLTARVMVNRIWQHHFGVGLVETSDNFGTTGSPPSHPELLDWLATEFVQRGWSIKSLHRLILCSTTWRQCSEVTERSGELDPDGRLLSRMPLGRMQAEVVRDSLLAVSGQLDETFYGPPDAVDVRSDGLVTSQSTDGGWRRSLFVLQRRTQIPTLLDNFDYPQMGPNCLKRGEAVVAPQALHLLNNATVHELAASFARRVARQAGEDAFERIHYAHRLALSRPPTPAELAVASQTLQELTRRWQDEVARTPAPNDDARAADRALVNYCHALLNSAAFLYID